MKGQPKGVEVLGYTENRRRCTKKSCRFNQHSLTDSPLFTLDRGADTPTLRTQVLVAHGIAWGVPPHAIRAQCGLTANHIRNVQTDALKLRDVC